MAQRILVVDDEPENQFLIRVILQHEGFDIVTRDDGVSALAALETESFDLVILDVMMPDLNGWQVFDRMRASARARAVPVIMLTAMAQRKDYEQAAQLGVKHYVTKPFEPDDLLTRIRSVLATGKS